MRTSILAAVAAVGLCLASATPAQAQYWQQYYYYYPNTGYVYNYPSVYSSYYPTYTTPYVVTPYTTMYTPRYTTYYGYDAYNPYVNQYRTWRWYRGY